MSNIHEKRDLLNYEIDMFNATAEYAKALNPLRNELSNMSLEAFVAHARILIDFFYTERVSDDIVAEDFVVAWKEIRPTITPLLQNTKFKANKLLAHLSESRLTLYKGWDIARIKSEIDDLIEFFLSKIG